MTDQNDTIPTRTLLRLIGALLIITLCIVVARQLFSSLYSSTDSVWSLSIESRYQAEKGDTILKIHSPIATQYSRIVSQTLNHPGSRVRYTKNKLDGRTLMSFIAEQDGVLEVSTEFMIHTTSYPRLQLFNIEPLGTQLRELYLQDDTLLEVGSPQLGDIISNLRTKSNDEKQLVAQIFRYIRSFKPIMDNPQTVRTTSELLNARSISQLERSLLMVALCRTATIPSRLVSGFVLQATTDTQPYYWVQVYLDNQWQSYDPLAGYASELPENYLPFRYNSSQIISLLDGSLIETSFNLEEADYTYTPQTGEYKNLLGILDFKRLPLETRHSLVILMLLPLGVLVTVLFRHFIGVRSYGVFTPTLLALAITRNDLTITLLTIILVFSMVIAARMAFPARLSRTLRLGIIAILVILSMGLTVSVVDYYFPSPEGIVVLLPVVILASLTDNFYRTMDSNGKRIALIRLAWTFIITLFCLPIMNWEALGQLLVNFPESHLLTLAAVLAVAHYRGKPLIGLIPLPLLREPAKKPHTKNSAHEG